MMENKNGIAYPKIINIILDFNFFGISELFMK
jgi:hypothetical protein